MKTKLFLSLMAGIFFGSITAFCEESSPQPTAPAVDNRPFMGKLQPGGAAPHGAMGGMPGGMMGGMGTGSPHGARARDEDAHWKLPAGWTQQPPTSVRVGSFLIKGDADRQAEVSVIPLPGEAGGKIPNLNLWRSQLGLDPVSDADAAQYLKPAKLGEHELTLVDLTSNEVVDGKSKLKLTAAILPRKNYTWFVKMIGDEQVVTKNKQAFLDFLSSLTFTQAKKSGNT